MGAEVRVIGACGVGTFDTLPTCTDGEFGVGAVFFFSDISGAFDALAVDAVGAGGMASLAVGVGKFARRGGHIGAVNAFEVGTEASAGASRSIGGEGEVGAVDIADVSGERSAESDVGGARFAVDFHLEGGCADGEIGVDEGRAVFGENASGRDTRVGCGGKVDDPTALGRSNDASGIDGKDEFLEASIAAGIAGKTDGPVDADRVDFGGGGGELSGGGGEAKFRGACIHAGAGREDAVSEGS